MNEIENRRYKETLDKEKEMRRAWNRHSAQDQVFEAGTESMERLNKLKDHLQDATSDPTRTMTGTGPQISRRKQLVALRNELRQSLQDVDNRIEKCESEGATVDPVVEAARAAAKERQKLPLHLRGTIVLT